MIGIIRTKAAKIFNRDDKGCKRVDRCPCGKLLLKVEVDRPEIAAYKTNNSQNLFKNLTKSPSNFIDDETQDLSCSSISSKGSLQRGTEHIQVGKLCLACSKKGVASPEEICTSLNELQEGRRSPFVPGLYIPPPTEIYVVEQDDQESNNALMTPCHSNLSSNKHFGISNGKLNVDLLCPSVPRRPLRANKPAFSFDLQGSESLDGSRHETEIPNNREESNGIDTVKVGVAGSVREDLVSLSNQMSQDENMSLLLSDDAPKAKENETASLLQTPSSWAICGPFMPTSDSPPTDKHVLDISSESIDEELVHETACLTEVPIDGRTSAMSTEGQGDQIFTLKFNGIDMNSDAPVIVKENNISSETKKKESMDTLVVTKEMAPAWGKPEDTRDVDMQSASDIVDNVKVWEDEKMDTGKEEVNEENSKTKRTNVPTNNQLNSFQPYTRQNSRAKYFQTQLSSLMLSESLDSLTEDGQSSHMEDSSTSLTIESKQEDNIPTADAEVIEGGDSIDEDGKDELNPSENMVVADRKANQSSETRSWFVSLLCTMDR